VRARRVRHVGQIGDRGLQRVVVVVGQRHPPQRFPAPRPGGELARLPDPCGQPGAGRDPHGLAGQPGRCLGRRRRVRQVTGQRHGFGNGTGRVHRGRAAVFGRHQHADLGRWPAGLAAVQAGGEREPVGTEQKPLREGPDGRGGPAAGGGGEHPVPRGGPAAQGGPRCPHSRLGPVAEPEEQQAPGVVADPHRRRGDVTGVTARLAGGEHAGGRAAEVGLKPSRAGVLDGYRDVLAVLGRAGVAEVLSQRRISGRRDRGQLDIDRQRLSQWRT
jgi:hypothetical protein